MRAIGSRAHRRSRGNTHRRGRLGVTLRMRDFFQLVQTISFNVGKTARKEPIALPSRVTQVRRSTYKLEDNIGPVVLIAVGVGAAFIPGMAEAQARRTRTVRVDDVHLVGVRSRAPIDAVHRLGRQRDAHAPTLRNRVHVARILAVGRLVPPIGGRALGHTDT